MIDGIVGQEFEKMNRLITEIADFRKTKEKKI